MWSPSNKRGWGALGLTTVGGKSGKTRSVLVGYIHDGTDLVALAMNGWGEGHPGWWLNLRAHPDAVVHLSDGTTRTVRVHEAVGDERDRLWQRWSTVEPQLDGYASLRSTVTPVVVLAPCDQGE